MRSPVHAAPNTFGPGVFRLLAFGLVLAASPLFAGPGVWTSSGPDGGQLTSVVVSPDQPERIYAGGGGGVFRSDNEGLTWQDISEGLPYRFAWRMAVDPTDADVLYVSVAGRIYKTTNAGANWTEPSPGFDPTWGTVFAFDINPASPAEITIATLSGGLRRSTNAGQSWTRLDNDEFEFVFGFAILPDNRDRILAHAQRFGESDRALFLSTDGGLNWGEATVPAAGAPGQMSLQATTGGRILAWHSSGSSLVYLSNDAGASFSNVSALDSFQLLVRSVAFDPTNADRWFAGGRNGLLLTEDNGTAFSIISNGMGPAAAGGYNGGGATLALKPGAPDVLFVGTDFTGFFRSPDAGSTWQRRNNGLRSTNIRALAIHPQNSSIIYAGFGDATQSVADNLFVTFDAGASWSLSTGGLDSGGVRALAVDPNESSNPLLTTVYSAGWGFEIPDVALPPRPFNTGVFKSTTGAASWSESGNGIPVPSWSPGPVWATVMRSLALDLTSGSGTEGDGPLQTVYVAGNGHISYADDGGTMVPTVHAARIHKSTDAGANWSAAHAGLPIPPFDDVNGGFFVSQVVPLVIDPAEPQTLYAGTFLNRVGNMADVQPDIDNGVFKSTDGGASWSLSSNGLPRFDEDDPTSSHWDVLALALAPSAPHILYAAADPPFEFRPTIIFRSTDHGANWVAASNGIPDDIDIRWLLVDPDNADVAYAAGGGTFDNPGSIYRTEDGGANWVSYSIGLPVDSATSLAIDKSGANPVLYAGTRGGVYRIEQVPDEDIDGVPDSIEQGAPNGGDGNGDGIPDFLQADVASLHAATGSARGISEFVSVELVEKDRSQCARIMNVHALSKNTFPLDPNFEYPYGMLRFEIPDCPGAQVRIIYHDKAGTAFDDAWQFRVYAPDVPGDISTIRWQSFGQFSSSDDNSWTLELTDGELGDLRPANGVILFQGGPARILNNEIFQDRFQSSP